ncbi:DUF2970 domain-containing protein [Thalassotalea euphylliae]|uniref:DUF2970 domain-containing protein n=1 Tax=Thalassotalea euphylliae TaxID=1655234 RepID=UPI0036295A1B
MTSKGNKNKDRLSWWQTVKSVGAAFFGVQSTNNHQQDFNKGKPIQFIIVGLLAVFLFIMSLVIAVSLVMPNN